MAYSRSQETRRRTAAADDLHGNLACTTQGSGCFAGATRRAILMAMAMGGGLLMVACERREGIPSGAVATLPATAEAADFLRMSQALTGHADLDATTAARLTQAFARAAPDVYTHFSALGALVHAGVSPPEVLAAATVAGLRPVALSIVAAWYTGTVGEGTRALTVSYREALMQRSVADALTPPTYVGGGPAWWTASPPYVGLAARSATIAVSAGSPR